MRAQVSGQSLRLRGEVMRHIIKMASLKNSFASYHVVVEHKCITTKASAKGPSIDHPAEKYVLTLNTQTPEMLQSMQSILRREAENAALKRTSFDDWKQVQVVYKSMFCHSVSTVAFYANESV